MSCIKYNNFAKDLRISGNVPYPYYYPYISSCPNIVGDPCAKEISCYFDYNGVYDPLRGTGTCHDNQQNNNICYKDRDPRLEKYDYLCYDQTPYQDPSICQQFAVQRLVSNLFEFARNFDINLLDPWGIVIADDVVWVANAGTGLITTYDLLGCPLGPIINVFGSVNNIGGPTGIVYNNSLEFIIRSGRVSGPAYIIVATIDGTINGYNFSVDPINAILVVDNTANNSVYRGLAIARINNRLLDYHNNLFLYAADFYNGKIDVFDSNFNQINNFSFLDEFSGDPIPEDYAPFNIVNIGDLLYVLYAKQDPFDNQYELPGTGNGYISIFSTNGTFIKRFVSRCVLNAPWGLALVPSWFGYPAGAIMVSNSGDGTINIFDCEGKFLGKLKDEEGHDICVDGLRALVNNPNYLRIIYWTASSNSFLDANVGTITSQAIEC